MVIWLPLWWTNRRSFCLQNTKTTVSAVKGNAQRIALVLQLVWTAFFFVNVQQIHVYVLALQRTARMMNESLSPVYCLIFGANINWTIVKDVGCFSSTAFLFMYSCIIFMITTGSSKNKTLLAVWISEYDLIAQKTSSISSHIVLHYLILRENSIGEQRWFFL